MADGTATDWVKPIFAITLLTDDLAAMKEFYPRVFGKQPEFEDETSAVYSFSNVVINVVTAAEGPDLFGPTPVSPIEAGTRAMLTINVDDTDAVVAALTDAGVSITNGPVDRPWGIRTATFVDPSGHVWEVASPLES